MIMFCLDFRYMLSQCKILLPFFRPNCMRDVFNAVFRWLSHEIQCTCVHFVCSCVCMCVRAGMFATDQAIENLIEPHVCIKQFAMHENKEIKSQPRGRKTSLEAMIAERHEN